MVKLKRHVETENDRYGGFNVDLRSAGNGYYAHTPDAHAVPQNTYDISELFGSFDRQTPPQSERAGGRARKSHEDLMPLVRREDKTEPTRRTGQKTLPSSLVLYLVAVLLLAFAVIASGIAVSGALGRANAMDDGRGELVYILNDQSRELAFDYDTDALCGAAADLE